MVEITGLCPPAFAPVRDRFTAHFDDGLEVGARFTACLDGEVVLDLMGGYADLAGARPFGPDTLATVFSTTKAVSAIMIARLVDRGLATYDTPVAAFWLEFGQAGKESVTLGQMISHQAGLPGLATSPAPGDWLDPPLLAARLAAQAPMWPLGTGSGYHPSTMSYLSGEVFRQLDGRTLGVAMREDLAGPLGLDFFIGLPEAEEARLAEIRKPNAPPNLGTIDAIKKAAFLDRGGIASSREWRAVELPGSNGVGTAEALAKAMAVVACGGMVGGVEILSAEGVAELVRPRVSGPDKVLPFDLTWAAGLMRNTGQFGERAGPNTVGHFGWGGSMAMADPDRRLSIGYVMNRQSPHLIADPRPLALTDALYGAL